MTAPPPTPIMNFIRGLVSAAFNSGEIKGRGIYEHCVGFLLDFDLEAFLQDSYDASTPRAQQDLGSIFIITGASSDAYMSTIRVYLQKTWSDNAFSVLDAIEELLVERSRVPVTGNESFTKGQSRKVLYPYSEFEARATLQRLLTDAQKLKNRYVNIKNNVMLAMGQPADLQVFTQQAVWLVTCTKSRTGDYARHSKSVECLVRKQMYRLRYLTTPHSGIKQHILLMIPQSAAGNI